MELEVNCLFAKPKSYSSLLYLRFEQFIQCAACFSVLSTSVGTGFSHCPVRNFLWLMELVEMLSTGILDCLGLAGTSSIGGRVEDRKGRVAV